MCISQLVKQIGDAIYFMEEQIELCNVCCIARLSNQGMTSWSLREQVD